MGLGTSLTQQTCQGMQTVLLGSRQLDFSTSCQGLVAYTSSGLIHGRCWQARSLVVALTSDTLSHDFGNHPACPARQSALSVLAWSHAKPLLEPVQQGSMRCDIRDRVLMALLLATRLPDVNTSQAMFLHACPMHTRIMQIFFFLRSTGMAGHGSAATYHEIH